MVLSDEQLRGIISAADGNVSAVAGLCGGFLAAPFDDNVVLDRASARALATELLERRAEVSRLKADMSDAARNELIDALIALDPPK